MMVEDVRDLLPLYALGALGPGEAKIVERAIAQDPALAAELAQLQAAATDGLIAPVAPAAHVKARLFASIGRGRFESFAPRMAVLFDVGLDRARELLALVERPTSWVPRAPGVELVDFDGGPAAAHADCGFVRLAPGAMFPPHTHLGEETSIVLAGSIHSQGRVLVAGDELVEDIASGLHQVTSAGDEPAIWAVRVFHGIEIGGVRVK